MVGMFLCMGKNCVSILSFEMTNKLEGSMSDIFYMEFSEAFDKVLHGRMVWKVNTYG